jgi:hypothetical protein
MTKVKKELKLHKLIEAVQRGKKRSLEGLGKYLYRSAQWKIRKRNKPSEPGKSPHTRKGRLRNAIAWERGTTSVLIGPRASAIGTIGSTHEFGGVEKKQKKTRRPNWKQHVGGYGPINIAGGKIMFGKLRTQTQVARSLRISAEALSMMGESQADAEGIARGMEKDPMGVKKTIERKYPKRPFMGPTLNLVTGSAPMFFRGMLKGG